MYSSCLSEEYNVPTSGKVNVSFAVTLPVPEEVAPTSRATYTDISIENIDLLVFDENNRYIERLKVEKGELTPTVSGVQFTVQMEATTKNRTVHLIANARTHDGATDRVNFSSITTNMLESAAIPNLQTPSLAGKTGEDVLLANITPLIMWSRISLAGVSMISKADDVKLLRAVACINVKKAATGEGLSDFVIERIALNRAADQGKIAPATYTTSPTATPTTANPVSITNYISYDKTYSEVSTNPVLYVYEKNNTASDYTSIIIQAKYKGRAGFYKIVMMNGNAPWNIIRNHRYNVTITSVSGYGYTDIATAVSSAPSNALKSTVTVEEDKEYPCWIVDGQYAMGATNNEVDIYGRRGSETITSDVEICRIYSTRPINPVATSTQTWLSDLTSTSVGTNIYKITGKLNYSASLASTEQTSVEVRCDNLSHTVNVSWTPGVSTVSDSDSYVVTLIGTNQNNWSVKVVDQPDWIGLHPTASSASAYPGSGMVRELTSKYYSRAYLHIGKSSTNRRAELTMSCHQDSNPVSRKIVVIQ